MRHFAVLVLCLAAGPNLIIDGRQVSGLPWGFIWSLPLLRSAEPARFMDFAYLVLSVVLAVWIAELTKSKLVLAAPTVTLPDAREAFQSRAHSTGRRARRTSSLLCRRVRRPRS